MQVQSYLFLDGRCEEAVEFYKKTLGAKVEMLMRFKESPDKHMGVPGAEEKVMHACIHIGETAVMIRRRLRLSSLSTATFTKCRRSSGLRLAVSVVRSMASNVATLPMLGGSGRLSDNNSEN